MTWGAGEREKRREQALAMRAPLVLTSGERVKGQAREG